MEFLLDFILHIDQHMIEIVQEYHTWAYSDIIPNHFL